MMRFGRFFRIVARLGKRLIGQAQGFELLPLGLEQFGLFLAGRPDFGKFVSQRSIFFGQSRNLDLTHARAILDSRAGRISIRFCVVFHVPGIG